MSIFCDVCVLIFTTLRLKSYDVCARTHGIHSVSSSLLPGLGVLRNDVTTASPVRTARLKAGGEFFWQRGVRGHSVEHFSFTNPRVHSSFTLRDIHLRRGQRTSWTQQVWLAVILFPDNLPFHPRLCLSRSASDLCCYYCDYYCCCSCCSLAHG